MHVQVPCTCVCWSHRCLLACAFVLASVVPVQIQPNKLLGVLGEHDGYPVEHIDLSHDQMFLRCAYAGSSVLDACLSQGRTPGETIEAADCLLYTSPSPRDS